MLFFGLDLLIDFRRIERRLDWVIMGMIGWLGLVFWISLVLKFVFEWCRFILVLFRMEIFILDRSRLVEEVNGRLNDSRDLEIFFIGDVGGSDDFFLGIIGRIRILSFEGGKWFRVKDMEIVGVGVFDWLEYLLEGDISLVGFFGEDIFLVFISMESWEGVVVLEVEGEVRDFELFWIWVYLMIVVLVVVLELDKDW